MSKSLSILALGLLSVVGMSAKDYTDTLVVTVNGTSTQQTATISVDTAANGTLNFSLKNFKLRLGTQTMGIGNIILNNLSGATCDKGTLVVQDTTVNITKGDDSSVSFWMGPSLGPIPLQLKLLVSDSKLYTLIDINMAALHQVIHVTFGDTYQLPNSGFEYFRTETAGSNTVSEPYNWHSFASGTGKYLSIVNALSAPHTYEATVTRPGSTGKHSLLIKSTDIFGVIANGTATTGRINAGAMNPADKANHAFLDLAKTDTDSHGDPFYVRMNGRPDSLAVWIKFKQATPNASYPYATISAYITDGTYFQDPQDKAYTNILAVAQDTTIVSKDFAWQRIVLPFDYKDKSVDGKSILITISTNATPGKGSANDSLYVDDISLTYRLDTPILSVDGSTVALNSDTITVKAINPATAVIAATTANQGSFSAMHEISSNDNQRIVKVIYATDDLQTTKAYTLVITKDGTSSVKPINTNSRPAAIYNVNGQRVANMQRGQIYIIKYTDGTVKKEIR